MSMTADGQKEYYKYFGSANKMSDQDYVELIQTIVIYYDRRAKHYKHLYLSFAIMRIILLAFLPVLSLIEFYSWSSVVIASISAVALVLESVSSVLGCRNKWETYRRACDCLCMEHRLYAMDSGIYEQEEKRLQNFVVNCETIIREEGEMWKMYVDHLYSKTDDDKKYTG
mgnify:FL=1